MAAYDDLITFYAGRFGVPTALSRAQMIQESHGDPKARSKVGAVGLFQVMPSTAAWLETFPEPAVMTGIWFLRYLYNGISNVASDDDRWKFALAAYNEGPAALEKTREKCKAAGKDPKKWEDVSPFAPLETRMYVANIWKNSHPGAPPLVLDPELTQ